MDKIEELSPDIIDILEKYKKVTNNQPVSLTMDDLAAIQKLAKELKKSDEAANTTFQEIQQLEVEIQERQAKIEELKQSVDPRIRYLKDASPVKTSNHVVKEEYAGITEEAIIQALEGTEGLGNSQIAEKLEIPNSKGVQNKIYGICKKSSRIKSDNRLWKLA